MASDAVLVWTAIGALAALASAAIAARYTYLAARMVRIQSQAKVIVFVRHDFNRPTILCIRIANIGHDVASDIQFTPSRAIPSRAFGVNANAAEVAKVMTDGPLIEGIPSLGPGDTREITWGQIGGLKKALGNDRIRLTFSYRSGRVKLTGDAVLEVNSYEGTDASTGPAVASARSLENIAMSLARLQATTDEISKALSNTSDGAP